MEVDAEVELATELLGHTLEENLEVELLAGARCSFFLSFFFFCPGNKLGYCRVSIILKVLYMYKAHEIAILLYIPSSCLLPSSRRNHQSINDSLI